MSRQITRELADKIAKKLKAKIDTKISKAHDMALVYEGKVLIATFGIRRGSEKDKGHDHIPAQIFVNSHFAKSLGQCPKSRAHWIEEMRGKGLIEE
jgi:hypothetical protein